MDLSGLNMVVYTLIFSAVILFVVLFVACIKRKRIPINVDVKKYDEEKNIYCLCEKWKITAILWLAFSIFINFISVVLSVTIIYLSLEDGGKLDVLFCSVFSLCSVVLNCLITPKMQAEGYRMAFEGLNKEILEYRSGMCSWENVILAAQRGESLITRYTFELL